MTSSSGNGGKPMRDAFVTGFEPLGQASAGEIRRLALPEAEELERIVGRDPSKWKPGAPSGGPIAAERTQSRPG
ncbi:MAG: hypothetical protein ACREQI_07300 [Candidatus Binataceae bacterium]